MWRKPCADAVGFVTDVGAIGSAPKENIHKREVWQGSAARSGDGGAGLIGRRNWRNGLAPNDWVHVEWVIGVGVDLHKGRVSQFVEGV